MIWMAHDKFYFTELVRTLGCSKVMFVCLIVKRFFFKRQWMAQKIILKFPTIATNFAQNGSVTSPF